MSSYKKQATVHAHDDAKQGSDDTKKANFTRQDSIKVSPNENDD